MSSLESKSKVLFKLKSEPESPSRSSDSAGFPISPDNRKEALADFDSESLEFKARSRIDQGKGVDRIENAKVLMGHGDHELAIRLLRPILKADPKQMRALVLTGEAYFKLGDLAKASSYFENCILAAEEDCPELFDAFKNLGNIELRYGDMDAAEENYNKAFTMNPDSDILMVNYGTLEIQRGDLQKALGRYRKAVQINRENDKGWIGLALIHREYGDQELAWANVERALDINPGNETGIRLLVDWAFKDNRLREAIDRVEKFLHVNNSCPEIWVVQAKLLFCAGRYKQAQHSVKKGLEIDPEVEGGGVFLTEISEALNERQRQV